MIIELNKLVGDKMPENITKKGYKCNYVELSEEMFKKELDNVLTQQVEKIKTSHSVEDFANLMIVYQNLIKEYNISYDEIKKSMDAKIEKEGSFDRKLYLMSIEQPELNKKNEKQR